MEKIITFVTEFISGTDFLTYGITEMNRRYGLIDGESQWTVDRDRDIYLRRVASGREEFAADFTYLLYWKGDLIRLKVREDGDTYPDLTGWTKYVLLEINLPAHLEDKRNEVLSDLKEALSARKGAGVFSPRISSVASFDF